MVLQVRRFALLLVALSVLSVALVACQTPAVTGSSSSGTSSGISLITPPANASSPTPTFPPFTIGAWPSNYSPGNPDTITIYVLCRVQDPSMQTPAQPPNPGVPVTILIGAPLNQSATVTTGADGVAATTVAFSDPTPGIPVTVLVSATFNGATYSNQTFFTPGATFTPTPAKKTPVATSSASPSVTASPTP
jgi:hypothetical protein